MTKRANSALPPDAERAQVPGLPIVVDFYRERGLPVIVQLPAAAEFAGLDSTLQQRGYRLVDPTVVLGQPVGRISARQPSGAITVTVSETLTPEWFRLWWSVDGRGAGAAAQAAQRILVATESLFLAVIDDGETRGVARLTATPGFGAVTCVAVSAGYRERGFGRLLLDAAQAETSRLGLDAMQLQVISTNPAVAWYQRAGFNPVSGYHYRLEADGAGIGAARTPR